MPWTIAEARRHLAEVLRAAGREPQPIYRREELVAVVIDRKSFEEFELWRKGRTRASLASRMAELRRLLDGVELEAPSRHDRKNPFLDEE